MADPVLKARKTVVTGKVETTYGTDATPEGGDAVKASNLELRPFVADEVERAFVEQTLGAQPTIPTGINVQLTFSVELAAGGTAGTAPGYAPLLKACGMSETLTVDTDAVYKPVSDAGDSATLHANIDGNLHKLVGARGTFELTIENGLPQLRFTFTGLYTAPSATALPTADFSAYQDALPISNANTPTFTLHGYAAVVRSLSISFGNEIQHEDLINSESVDRTDRQTTGSITINAPPLGSKDFFAIAKDVTLGALQLIHGTTAGAIVQIDAPKVQIGNPRYGDASSKKTLEMDLRLTPDAAGDDEFILTAK